MVGFAHGGTEADTNPIKSFMQDMDDYWAQQSRLKAEYAARFEPRSREWVFWKREGDYVFYRHPTKRRRARGFWRPLKIYGKSHIQQAMEYLKDPPVPVYVGLDMARGPDKHVEGVVYQDKLLGKPVFKPTYSSM